MRVCLKVNLIRDITYVLSHDHVGIDLSELPSDHSNLLGGDVVGRHEHSVLVLGGDSLESSPVGFLLDSLFRFLDGWHLCS